MKKCGVKNHEEKKSSAQRDSNPRFSVARRGWFSPFCIQIFFLFLKIPRIIFALFQGHAKEEKKEELRAANNR